MIRPASATARLAIALIAALPLAACDLEQDAIAPVADRNAASVAGGVAASVAEVTPDPLVTVAFAGRSVELWPFTSGTIGGAAIDPINVLFPDRSATAVRAALLFLDGNRTAFGMPNAPPFNCRWKEAVGGMQVGYAAGAWTGSAIQLECGEYSTIRFHIRLFPAGESTIANAHFEVLVPGTDQHAVLSWELAEQLVKVDFVRSGLLNPAAPLTVTTPINPSPWRTINPLIYNGLPEELRQLIGGPPAPVGVPVPILTDGRATVLNLASSPEGEPMLARRELTIQFNQIIPKPFCASGPFDFLLVRGPVTVQQTVLLTRGGTYMSRFHATGSLELTPVNPLASPPTFGESFRAQINEVYKNIITDHVTLVSTVRVQMMIPPTGPFRGSLFANLRIGPGEASQTDVEVRCSN